MLCPELKDCPEILSLTLVACISTVEVFGTWFKNVDR